MLKPLLVIVSTTLLSPTLFAQTTTPQAPFIADTTIVAGEYSVPCTFVDSSGNSIPEVLNTRYMFKDSLNRLIKSHWVSGNSAHGNSNEVDYSVKVNENFQIIEQEHYSYAKAPMHGAGVRTIFTAIEHNPIGMPTEGELYRTTFSSGKGYSRTSTLNASLTLEYHSDNMTEVIDTLWHWKRYTNPDTAIIAGALSVPVSYTAYAKLGSRSRNDTTTYVDTLGRTLYSSVFVYDYAYNNSRSRSTESILSLDSLNNVVQVASTQSSSYQGESTNDSSLLVGTEWNQKGMITQGVYTIYNQDDSQQGLHTTRDTTVAQLRYRSDGVTLIETTYERATPITTGVAPQENKLSMVQSSGFVLLSGVQPGGDITLYNLRGQKIITTQANLGGLKSIDITALSSGVYLLRCGLANLKLRIR